MKKWLTLTLAVAMTLCFGNLVCAYWPTNMEGEPVGLLQQHLEGYFIWHDGSGFHLKVVAADGVQHIFTGVIDTDGRIENIMTKSSDSSDYSRLTSDRETLKFQLSGVGQVAAIDFNVFRGRSVKFELSMDGKKIDVNKIYFGPDGWHPNNAVFSVDYHDDDYHDDYSVHEHIILNWWWPWPHYGHRRW
ncbi:MAG TPA: hypothetical protein DDW50_20865 [Firmicutes bacterium]|nr:hypothetical protein [Bacillota bacterium]